MNSIRNTLFHTCSRGTANLITDHLVPRMITDVDACIPRDIEALVPRHPHHTPVRQHRCPSLLATPATTTRPIVTTTAVDLFGLQWRNFVARTRGFAVLNPWGTRSA